jgi:hypothetical protein
MVGLLGYGLGRRQAEAPLRQRAATAVRGWRAESPSASRPGPPRRFRDFRIGASSWELAHPPVHASDGDPYTFWHAWKSERFAEGEWLTLTFPEARVVTRIGLMPGRAGAGSRAEGRVKSLLVKTEGAEPQKLFFDDRSQVQYRDLPEPIRAKKLILRIGTVRPGRETRHIVVPEVQVWGFADREPGADLALRQKVEPGNPTSGG